MFSHSNFGVTQYNSASEKVFLFSDSKREKPMKRITFNDKMRKMKMLSDSKAYIHTPGNMYQNVIKHEKPSKPTNKSFVVESRKTSSSKKHKLFSHSNSKTSLSPSASLIYQNNFYQSNYNNFRREMLAPKDNHNSYSSSIRANHSSKRKKPKQADTKGIRMQITKLNASASKTISKSNTRIPGKRKLMHNIKIKRPKNDLGAIMTIKNTQM